MAKLVILAVRDRAVDAFMRPFVVQHVGQGVRTFGDEINRASQDNPLAQHPEDYDLYELGCFVEETGVLEPVAPRMVAVGKDLVRS